MAEKNLWSERPDDINRPTREMSDTMNTQLERKERTDGESPIEYQPSDITSGYQSQINEEIDPDSWGDNSEMKEDSHVSKGLSEVDYLLDEAGAILDSKKKGWEGSRELKAQDRNTSGRPSQVDESSVSLQQNVQPEMELYNEDVIPERSAEGSANKGELCLSDPDHVDSGINESLSATSSRQVDELPDLQGEGEELVEEIRNHLDSQTEDNKITANVEPGLNVLGAPVETNQEELYNEDVIPERSAEGSANKGELCLSDPDHVDSGINESLSATSSRQVDELPDLQGEGEELVEVIRNHLDSQTEDNKITANVEPGLNVLGAPVETNQEELYNEDVIPERSAEGFANKGELCLSDPDHVDSGINESLSATSSRQVDELPDLQGEGEELVEVIRNHLDSQTEDNKITANVEPGLNVLGAPVETNQEELYDEDVIPERSAEGSANEEELCLSDPDHVDSGMNENLPTSCTRQVDELPDVVGQRDELVEDASYGNQTVGNETISNVEPGPSVLGVPVETVQEERIHVPVDAIARHPHAVEDQVRPIFQEVGDRDLDHSIPTPSILGFPLPTDIDVHAPVHRWHVGVNRRTDINISQDRQRLRLLRAVRSCLACEQGRTATVNLPCRCVCYCLDCAPRMTSCTRCRAWIEEYLVVEITD